jgi:hypothetical protein
MVIYLNSSLQEIAFAHKRALEGCGSHLQVAGMLAKLCLAAKTAKEAK